MALVAPFTFKKKKNYNLRPLVWLVHTKTKQKEVASSKVSSLGRWRPVGIRVITRTLPWRVIAKGWLLCLRVGTTLGVWLLCVEIRTATKAPSPWEFTHEGMESLFLSSLFGLFPKVFRVVVLFIFVFLFSWLGFPSLGRENKRRKGKNKSRRKESVRNLRRYISKVGCIKFMVGRIVTSGGGTGHFSFFWERGGSMQRKGRIWIQ